MKSTRAWQIVGGAMSGPGDGQQKPHAGSLFYSSAIGYDLTKRRRYAPSACVRTERLEQRYKPKTHLITFGLSRRRHDCRYHDELEILGWGSGRQEDSQMVRTLEKASLRNRGWFVRPDGSIIHSVHSIRGTIVRSFQLHGCGRRETQS